MKPFQQRVIQEKQELDEKISKLDQFCKSTATIYTELPNREKSRLTLQLNIMRTYSNVLAERIEAFTL